MCNYFTFFIIYLFSLFFQKQNKKQSSMDEVFLRFPHLSENIFDSLNSESLAKSKEVCISWYQYLDDQKFLQTRANKVKEIIDTVEKLGHVAKVYQVSVYQTNRIAFDVWTRNAIIYFARNGNFDLVHTLILKSIKLMYYPLHPILNEIEMGHFVVVKYLVDTMEDKNPKIDKRHGWTLVHLAAKLGRIDIVKYVMSKVSNIIPKDNHGQTPLHIAATFGKLDVVKLIMEKLEIKSPKDNNGKTPLHNAARNGNLIVFKYIVENVDEKNPKDNDSNTPLDLARHRGFLELFKLNLKISGYRVIGRHSTMEGIY